MRGLIWLGLTLAGIAGVSPFVMQAQIMSHPCCNTCQQPVVQCYCQRTRPVVQTHLRAEQVTTYRDVVETRYRQDCVVEQTPVTTMENRVETVWVPTQVTRQVARTVMVPQAKSRMVPYQVVQRIPQTTTRMVPYQTVHHMTETVPMTYAAPPVSLMPAMVIPAPQTASTVPHRAPPLGPSPAASGHWQTIAPRAPVNRPTGYESDQPVPMPVDAEPAVRKSTWRGHVPGAASAWNYSDRTYR